MIDLTEEKAISLNEAATLVPSARQGRPTHVSTLIRWITAGVEGNRLEAIRLGGRWVTSREALQRFAERLTSERRQTMDQAEQELRAIDVNRAAAV